jgi:hypothetical protein
MVEVVWAGKYDGEGRRVAPLKVQLPLQTIEAVNESTQERQRRLERFVIGREDSEWRNRLIWGDKKYVLLRDKLESFTILATTNRSCQRSGGAR